MWNLSFLALVEKDWTRFAHCDYNNLDFAHGSVSTSHVTRTNGKLKIQYKLCRGLLNWH